MKYVAVLLLLLIAAGAAIVCFRPLSVVGPEGLDVEIVAVEYSGKLIKRYDSRVIDNFTRVAVWDDKVVKLVRDKDGPSPLNIFGQPAICENGPKWWYLHDGGELLVEVSRPQLIASFTPPSGWRSVDSSSYDLSEVKEVVWVNELPNGTVVKRVGKLIPAEFIIQISSQGKEGDFGLYQWKDIDIWFRLYGVSWTPYDPDPPEGYKLVNEPKAYVVPLIIWVKASTPWLWRDQDGRMVDYEPYQEMRNWLSFYPDLAGREFTMYYDVSEYYGEVPSREDIISDNPLKYVVPDPRMSDEVFIHLHIDRYGPYAYTQWLPNTVLEIYYPASYIKVKTLVLVWGEFHYVWTSQESQEQGYEWENRTSSNYVFDLLGNLFKPLSDFLKSPVGILTSLIILGIIVLLILVLLGSGPKVIVIRK